MKPHIQTLIQLLTNKDFKALLTHYQQCNEQNKIDMLAFVYQQSQKSLSVFEFYQQIATKFIEAAGLPEALIMQINSSDALSFFTPALKLNQYFTRTNYLQRNVLHYLLAGKNPPFNYLRSMLLFESNEALSHALIARDCKDLTPVEVYLRVNNQFETLAPHELSALLGLMEAEQTLQAINPANLTYSINHVVKNLQQQGLSVNERVQRIGLMAAYYGKTACQIVSSLHS